MSSVPKKVYVGLDVSLNSPAMSVYDGGKWHAYCFQQLRKDSKLPCPCVSNNVSVHLLPPIPGRTTERFERYRHIVTHLVSAIDAVGPANIHVRIEGYGFAACGQGSSYKLHELSGILAYTLHAHEHVCTVSYVPPTQWKRIYVQNGFATKQRVVEQVEADLDIDLYSMLGRSRNAKEVPKPVQDIADAVGLVHPSVKEMCRPGPAKRKGAASA